MGYRQDLCDHSERQCCKELYSHWPLTLEGMHRMGMFPAAIQAWSSSLASPGASLPPAHADCRACHLPT